MEVVFHVSGCLDPWTSFNQGLRVILSAMVPFQTAGCSCLGDNRLSVNPRVQLYSCSKSDEKIEQWFLR